MKLSVAKANAFFERPDTTLRLYLLYGPDGGLVRERAAKIGALFVDDINDAFAVSDIPPASIADDPARLGDEMASVSMLGGRRLIRLRGCGDEVFPAVDALLSHPPKGNNVAVLEAGELEKRSRLRARVEDDEKAIALPCYAEEGAALDRTVADMARAEGFTLERDALSTLTALLPPDRIGIRMEMEKLMTYARGRANGRITLEDVEAVITDAGEQDVDDAIWAAAGGQHAALEKLIARMAGEGVNAVAVLRAAQRHLLRLYELQALAAHERLSMAEAMKQLRPPVFFKREAAMLAQVKRWPARKIERALQQLLEAEVKVKTTGFPAERLGERALLSLARMA